MLFVWDLSEPVLSKPQELSCSSMLQKCKFKSHSLSSLSPPLSPPAFMLINMKDVWENLLWIASIWVLWIYFKHYGSCYHIIFIFYYFIQKQVVHKVYKQCNMVNSAEIPTKPQLNGNINDQKCQMGEKSKKTNEVQMITKRCTKKSSKLKNVK